MDGGIEIAKAALHSTGHKQSSKTATSAVAATGQPSHPVARERERGSFLHSASDNRAASISAALNV